MSSIAAIAGINGMEDAGEITGRMCAVMADRGNDGAEILQIGRAWLGRNLCLYDRAPDLAERGIFIDENSGLTVLLDGELYNASTLAGELGCENIDETVIAEAYGRWGRACLPRFRGAFSFVIWDGKERVLFAARDFFGEKPVYYHIASDGTITLASAVRGILRNPGVSREIDYEAVSHYMYEKAFIYPDTPLKYVKSLPHGGWLEWRSGVVETGRYWHPPYGAGKIEDPIYATARYRDLMLEAITKRLPRDYSSPGLLYSGGTDSNLLLGMIKHVTDRKITTLSITDGMSGRDLDYSRRLAKRFDTEHREIRMSAASIRENLADLVWTYGTPGVSIVQAFFGTKEAHKIGVKVAFTGLGVEPTLEPLWYLKYINILEKAFSPFKALPEKSREGIYDLFCRGLRGSGSRWKGGKYRKAISILYYYFMFKRGYYRWYGTGLFPDGIKSLFSGGIDKRGWKVGADGYRDIYRDCPVSDPHDLNNMVLMNKGLTVNAVPKFESAGAFNRVLMRFPFLDQDVAEFALGVSYDLKYRGGRNKFLVRENCRSFVSEECAQLGKQDFKPPFEGWMRGELWPVLEKIISREAVEERGIFDYDRLWPLYERFKNDKSALPWADIMAPVTLELWLRLHVDPAPGDTSRPEIDF
ncbi:MAG: hypothetical protein JW814_05655 [Candidatus Krumholzibacteriota bacterium]|nr:hypothetical protein [Candidatus Krumholzibacteriota bacterium]